MTTSKKGTRLIDGVEAVRTTPVRVLYLGQSRTGTSSLREFLAHLGFRPYHYSDMICAYQRDIPLWTEAIQAKYQGKGELYGREEFDKLLGDFDCIGDNPSILFVNELLQAYPDAKVILTNRAVDKWVESIKRTVFAIRESIIYKLFYRLHPLSRIWYPFSGLLCSVWFNNEFTESNARQVYFGYYAHVRRVVPKQKLLEYNFGDGLEPLCNFLDVPVPSSVAYPHSNDAREATDRLSFTKRELIRIALNLATAGALSVYVARAIPSLFISQNRSQASWNVVPVGGAVLTGAWCVWSAICRSPTDIRKTLFQDVDIKRKEESASQRSH